MKKIVVGITGASGVIVGIRLIEELLNHQVQLFGIVTHNARKVIEHELDKNYSLPTGVICYDEFDGAAPINSSSYLIDAMVIAPCSMKTLAAIATGYTSSLIVRAADNQLRTGRPLILSPRETPLSSSHLKNMLKLKQAGAIICPPMAAYYHHPQSIDDMTNFFVGKILDLLGIANSLYQRWGDNFSDELLIMTFLNCIEQEQRTGSLKFFSEPFLPYLQVSKKLIQFEPDPVLFQDVLAMQVAGNIFCSRDRFAEYLQLPKTNFLSHLSQKLHSHEIKLIEHQKFYGDEKWSEIDLSKLPILFHYPGDGGHYITSAVWIVNDPECGRNLSYHRMMALNKHHGSVRVVENRGMHQALAHSSGKAEVAICIGAPPSVLLAASFSPASQVDELELAAKLDSIELVNCRTVDLQVPADCEIILEGYFTGEFANEGPFVDITGTWDIVRRQPIVEITRIAHRTNPIFHALVPGRAEHKILMGMPKEVDIFQAVNQVCRCNDVTMTSGGCSWLHAIIQIRKEKNDDGKKALDAAFQAHRSLKHCIVVDEDIDIHNIHEVEWAVATRFQADKDLIVMTDQPSSSLDPSAMHVEGQKSRGAKMGLDATIKKFKDERKMFERIKL